MADYWCANCGERSSMMGHYRNEEIGFTCKPKPKDEGRTMTEPSEAAKAKVLELANAGARQGMHYEPRDFNRPQTLMWTFARFIQAVSDAAKEYEGLTGLAPFILPEPVDPLAKALAGSVADPEQFAAKLRDRLTLHGLKIVEDKP